MSDSITITIDDKQVSDMLKGSKSKTKQAIDETIDKGSKLVSKIMVKNINKGATGEAKKSVGTKKTANGTLIGPEAKHAIFLEKGTRPHFPPAFKGSSLDLWSQSKGIPTYAVAKSIARKGTKAHPFMDKSVRQSTPGVQAIFRTVTARMLKEMNSGG